MLSLKNKYKEIFDFNSEKEPIVFISKIFEYINNELKFKDKDINNYLYNLINNFNKFNKIQTISQKTDCLKIFSFGIFFIKKNETMNMAAKNVKIATKPYHGTKEVTL